MSSLRGGSPAHLKRLVLVAALVVLVLAMVLNTKFLTPSEATALKPAAFNAKTYVEYSVFKDPVSVDWSIISDDKELDVLGAHLGPHCWPAAIRMIESGVLPMDKICTHQLPLAKFQEGLDLVASGQSSIKVSLIPS